MRDTDDGFVIAEEDLRLRGAGELLGTRQSGLAGISPGRSRRPCRACWQPRATMRDWYWRAIRSSKSPRGEALRVLLYLFERDEAVKYLRTG